LIQREEDDDDGDERLAARERVAPEVWARKGKYEIQDGRYRCPGPAILARIGRASGRDNTDKYFVPSGDGVFDI
jgi:hypothetical protein